MIDPGTATLIGSGLQGVLGGLFGFGSQRAARKLYQRQMEDRLNTGVHAVEAAKRSGFNPITMLSAMGAGGNIGGQPDFSIPLASQQLISGAIQTASDEFTGVNSQKRARDQLELDLAKIKVDTALIEAQARQTRARAVGPVFGGPGKDPLQVKGSDGETRTSPKLFGARINPSEDQSDAEAFEQRYGDPASWAIGLANAMYDYKNNATRKEFGPERDQTPSDVFRGMFGEDMSTKPDSEVPPRILARRHGDSNPDGFTEDGRAYWLYPDGSLNFKPRKAK